MAADLKKFIRATPRDALRTYLQGRAERAFAHIEWDAGHDAFVETVCGIVDSLPDVSRDRLFSEVDRASQFRDNEGRRMLRSVLPDDEELLASFDGLAGTAACALFVLMQRGDAFENALAALYAQRLLNGRDWTGLDFEPDQAPIMLPSADVGLFTARLIDIFAADGPRPRLFVDHFTRREPDPGGGGPLSREQFTVYVEGPPETALAFDAEAVLSPNIVRRVHEAALLFDPQEGTLDVVAKGGGKARRQFIADAFVGTMLRPGARLASRARRTLALDILKERPTFQYGTEDRVKSVAVVRLKLVAPDHGAIATFEVPSRSLRRGDGDFYQRAERAFGRENLLGRAGWSVVAVGLRSFLNRNVLGRARKA